METHRVFVAWEPRPDRVGASAKQLLAAMEWLRTVPELEGDWAAVAPRTRASLPCSSAATAARCLVAGGYPIATPPRSTAPNVVPLDERRVTPKLNRNSGSKAIAQAQMFEAMAAAQLRDDNGLARRVSGRSAHISTISRASASVYSEDGQISNLDVRPQSSVSQRANDTSSAALPMREQPPLTDPAIFAASVPAESKRNSRASASSQRKRSSKTYVARRPGKRVSPRSLLRKSLVDTMSSRPGKAKQASTGSLPVFRAPKESRQAGYRAQAGRKTTSAYLRDLDDLVGQESIPKLPRNGQPRGRANTSRT